jgi:hypothetical protein
VTDAVLGRDPRHGPILRAWTNAGLAITYAHAEPELLDGRGARTARRPV